MCVVFSPPLGCTSESESCIQLSVTPWTVAYQAPLSMEFSRQEYWSGLPFPPPGNLPNPGNEPTSPASPAMQVDSLPAEPPRKPTMEYYSAIKNEIIPFTATWMDPEIAVLSEVSQTKINISMILFLCGI